jgi:PAS domain S-box-containing protein
MSQVDRIQDNAELFEQLLERHPDAIQSVDPNGRIIYANATATQLLGYTNEELVGMHISQLYAPELLSLVQSGFHKLQREGELSVCDSAVLDKAGKRIAVEIRSFGIYDAAGQFVRTFSILRDIRSVKAMHDRLMHASRLAAVGELAASLVHDIANPLSTIRLAGTLLQEELKMFTLQQLEPDSLQTSLEIVGTAVDKIEKLVVQLRNVARNDSASPQPFDLCKAIRDATLLVTGKLRKTTVKHVLNLPEQRCMSLGRESEIEQVFMNLFSNACDAMQDAEQRVLTISLGSEMTPDGKRWRCIVEDTGSGIAEEDLPHVLESFFTTKEKGEGTGLGLAIVQSILRHHGGDVSVSSELGKGSVFTVRLPALD